MHQDICSPVTGALVFKRTLGSIPERCACAHSVREPGDWVIDRGLVRSPLDPPAGQAWSVGAGGLQSHLEEERNGPNLQI